jgi:enamine deaminase RidA (YjgF/YER057c/UK114 family)
VDRRAAGKVRRRRLGPNGNLAVGDFPAQMKQVMENLTSVLKASRTDWDRVVKTTCF